MVTIESAIEALKKIKTYCAANQLADFDYVIKVMERLQAQGVTDPLKTDFTKLKGNK